ncbi:unnamed protein product [Nesidiocoris tenuis]|uniref:Uncharacterized protein n=1 Tax=Nesidiocoris tenuis TaxID=355587 RepID=A0A6H5GCE1_9HEMI|nr:unnamed protein product [Nesidiocoris tenuis]
MLNKSSDVQQAACLLFQDNLRSRDFERGEKSRVGLLESRSWTELTEHFLINILSKCA